MDVYSISTITKVRVTWTQQGEEILNCMHEHVCVSVGSCTHDKMRK